MYSSVYESYSENLETWEGIMGRHLHILEHYFFNEKYTVFDIYEAFIRLLNHRY